MFLTYGLAQQIKKKISRSEEQKIDKIIDTLTRIEKVRNNHTSLQSSQFKKTKYCSIHKSNFHNTKDCKKTKLVKNKKYQETIQIIKE